MSDRSAVLPGVVVVDTGVYGAGLVLSSGSLRIRYAPHLLGRRVILSYQTVAELRFGALVRNWGEGTIQAMEERLRKATVAQVDDPTASAYARLKAECRRLGHPLHQKIHDGDRWIAATAIRYSVPLISDDGVFRDAPGLELITAPENA